jgi:tripartite motif-containing protein 71
VLVITLFFDLDPMDQEMVNSVVHMVLPVIPEVIFFMVEHNNHRVQVFDKTGKLLFKCGSNGSGNGQFTNPLGVTVDQRNNQIVVADSSNHRIQVFDEKGVFIRAIGSSGNGDGQLFYPRGVVVDHQGNYFVTENGSHRAQF